MVNNEKMSKSLGNFLIIEDIKNKNISGEILRIAVISADYRKPLNFSEKLISDSTKQYNKFKDLIYSGVMPESLSDQTSVDILSDNMNFSKYFATVKFLIYCCKIFP